MPFELGLAVAVAGTPRDKHRYFMFESMNNRILKSLSDMNGTQVFIHDENTARGVLYALLAIFSRPKGHPTSKELVNIWEDLKKASCMIKEESQIQTLYHAYVFDL